jgi:hypothetical protein
MGDSSHEGDSKHDTIEKPRGVVLTMPKRQLRLEEVLFGLGNKSFPSKVALVLEWSLAGAAIQRSRTEPVQFRGPSN